VPGWREQCVRALTGVRACRFVREGADKPAYVQQLAGMALETRTTLYVDYADLLATNAELAQTIVAEYYRCGAAPVALCDCTALLSDSA
jgi:hypothetical protein